MCVLTKSLHETWKKKKNCNISIENSPATILICAYSRYLLFCRHYFKPAEISILQKKYMKNEFSS